MEIIGAGDPAFVAVERLRYTVYVQEQGKSIASANHLEQRLADGLDSSAIHFVLRRDGQLLAAGRINVIPPAHPLSIRAGLSVAERVGLDRIAYVSKTLAQADYRGATEVGAKLMRGMILWAVKADIKVGFCHCGDRLASLYQRLGFRALPQAWQDEHVGQQKLLAIFTDDLVRYRHFRQHLGHDHMNERTVAQMRSLRQALFGVPHHVATFHRP